MWVLDASGAEVGGALNWVRFLGLGSGYLGLGFWFQGLALG